jgi:hypothetical protein
VRVSQQNSPSASKEISTANAELDVLAFKIVCLQKTLDQANRCASQKADCLAVELDSDNDEIENENDPQNIVALH